MKLRKKIKTAACITAAVSAFLSFGMNAFSIIDFSAGESGLICDETTPYKVNIVSEGKNAAVIPVGVGLRGDADGNGSISIIDAIKISRYIIGNAGDDFAGSFGFAMADTNLSGKVDIVDAINVSKYLMTKGTHEERWKIILGL